MLKNLTKLEYKIGERLYQFVCDPDSPMNEVKEALFQFQKYVGKIEDAVNESLKAKEQESGSESKIEDIGHVTNQ